MYFHCPVCFYNQMPYPPEDYHICPCCGTEFGNDDVEFGYDNLRINWIAAGAPWFFGDPPRNWNAWAQLADANFGVVRRGAANANIMEIGYSPLHYSLA
jgi:hypothetical protein